MDPTQERQHKDPENPNRELKDEPTPSADKAASQRPAHVPGEDEKAGKVPPSPLEHAEPTRY